MALTGETIRARRNLAIKMKLEATFLPEISSYFTNITSEFRTLYASTRNTLQANFFSDRTKQLLQKQYFRAAKVFKNEMRLEGGKSFNWLLERKQEDEELDALVDASLLTWFRYQSGVHGALIDATNIKDINESIVEAERQLIDQGLDTTTVAVAAAASIILRRKFAARKQTIATTETQFASETTKAVEARVFAADGDININNPLAVGAPIIVEVKKEWAAVLDEKTREAHVRADGQVVNESQPFIVNGEKLMYPGDSTTFNASAANTINCRCAALYGV